LPRTAGSLVCFILRELHHESHVAPGVVVFTPPLRPSRVSIVDVRCGNCNFELSYTTRVPHWLLNMQQEITERRRSSATLPLNGDQTAVSYGATTAVFETDLHYVGSLHNSRNRDEEKTYFRFLENRNFQLYLLSYIANHVGEWLTYLASLSTIEAIQFANGQTSTSGVAISRLVMIRLLPNVIFSPLGGVLADRRDRRQVMIALDLAGSAVAWLFILAVQFQSIPMVYVATFAQECLSGMYEPSRSSIIPLLVSNEEDMKKATTVTGIAWSTVAAFGCGIGGFLVGRLGLQACYVIDSMTYMVSALLMTIMGGKWNVATRERTESSSMTVKGFFFDGVHYLQGSFFGPLVLLNASASLVYGGFDVLNVSFAERGSLEGRASRLGMLFACIGIGCWAGPMLFDRHTDMSNPKTLQLSCLYSLGFFIATGCILMGIFSQFWAICFLNAWRAAGSAALWISSTLLLQKFSTPSMLGRVLAMDHALSLMAESFSAFVVGMLRNDCGISAEQVSLVLGSLAIVVLACWSIYHYQGRGAAGFLAITHSESDFIEKAVLLS
jgi:MFS family permease